MADREERAHGRKERERERQRFTKHGGESIFLATGGGEFKFKDLGIWMQRQTIFVLGGGSFERKKSRRKKGCNSRRKGTAATGKGK
jgi:hypothetical protein